MTIFAAGAVSRQRRCRPENFDKSAIIAIPASGRQMRRKQRQEAGDSEAERQSDAAGHTQSPATPPANGVVNGDGRNMK